MSIASSLNKSAGAITGIGIGTIDGTTGTGVTGVGIAIGAVIAGEAGRISMA
jgi:hypothetical protein